MKQYGLYFCQGVNIVSRLGWEGMDEPPHGALQAVPKADCQLLVAKTCIFDDDNDVDHGDDGDGKDLHPRAAAGL